MGVGVWGCGLHPPGFAGFYPRLAGVRCRVRGISMTDADMTGDVMNPDVRATDNHVTKLSSILFGHTMVPNI